MTKKLSVCLLLVILVFIISLFFIALSLSRIQVQDDMTFKKTAFPSVNVSKDKHELKLISTFSTYILSKNINRLNNIKVALKSLDGLKIFPNREYSFNALTGKRTKENGYKEAKIIKDGDYVEGLGGGVCQVSTTLYNALILADISITEVHSHTLKPSYVSCSFDAMVSYGTSDLKFINETDDILFVKAKVKEQNIVVEIYGEDKDFEIKRVSRLKEEIPFGYEIQVDTENKFGLNEENPELVLKEGSTGCKTEGYLRYYKDGKFVKEKKIRTDVYSARHGVKVKYFN